MGLMRCQVNLDRDSAIPADVITNTWHFVADDTDAADLTSASAVASALSTFYNAITTRLSAVFAGTGTVDVYDLHEPKPRVPILTQAITTFTPNTTGLPSEVALCLSMQAAPISGISQARRRGRVYIGPLAVATSAVSGTGGDVRPTGACQTNLLTAAAALTPVVAGSRAWSLCVYSPTTFQNQGGDVELSAFPVASFWVDDAFDVQRRRGAPVTSRATASA